MAGLEDELKHVGVEIKKLESKQERVEAALEGWGSYLGTTDRVSVCCPRTTAAAQQQGVPPTVHLWYWVFSVYSRYYR